MSHLANAYPRTTKNATRSNRPRKLEPQLHAAIGAFLADLLAAQGNEEGGGWLRLSLAKNAFKKPSLVSYRMFAGVRTSWKAARLIEEHAGYPGKLGFGNPGPVFGSMTRFRATPKLLKLSGDHGILVVDLQDHFFIEFEMPSELVQLTSPAGSTRNTAEAKTLRSEIAELNAHFATHKLDGARHIGWVRKFHGVSSDKYALEPRRTVVLAAAYARDQLPEHAAREATEVADGWRTCIRNRHQRFVSHYLLCGS